MILRKALRYPYGLPNLCAGVAMTGIQSFVLQKIKEKNNEHSNEFKNFIKRIEFILKHINVNEIAINISQIKNNIKKSPKLFDMTEDARFMLELACFMECVELYHNAHLYDQCLGGSVSQSEQEKIAYFVQPVELEKHGGLITLTSFSGIYLLSELTKYMGLMHHLARSRKIDLALQLGSDNHAIAACYDYKQDAWNLIDLGSFSKAIISSSDKLAQKIFSSFESDDAELLCGFETKFFAAGNNREEMRAFIDALIKEEVFISIHALSLKRAQMSNERGVTLAHIMCFSGDNASLVKLVELQKGKDELVIDFNRATDPDGLTPILAAGSTGNLEALKILASLRKTNGDMHVNFNGASPNGAGLCYIAAATNQVAILAFLASLKQNDAFIINFNAENINGATPVYIAAQHDHIAALKFLATLKHPDHTFVVNFNKAKINGTTPIQVAVAAGSIATLKFLAELKNPDGTPVINLDEKDRYGDTLDDIARKFNQKEVEQLLSELRQNILASQRPKR